jgi:hypothetical protein
MRISFKNFDLKSYIMISKNYFYAILFLLFFANSYYSTLPHGDDIGNFSKGYNIISFKKNYGDIFLVRIPIHQGMLNVENMMMDDFEKK